MEPELICQDPPRYRLCQVTVKKSLFGKKETTLYAIGDENLQPLTPFAYEKIFEYDEGFVLAWEKAVQIKDKPGRLLDLNGRIALPKYDNMGYRVTVADGMLRISKGLEIGLATLGKQILVRPADNSWVEVHGDVVIYGKQMIPTIPESGRLGAGRVEDGKLVPLLPLQYNFVRCPWEGCLIAGRLSSYTERTPAGLLKDKVVMSVTGMFMLFSAYTGKPLCKYAFRELNRDPEGKITGVVYPGILPGDLVRPTTGTDTSGSTDMDFSQLMEIELDKNYEIVRQSVIPG